MTLDFSRPVLLDTKGHKKEKKQRMKPAPASDTQLFSIKMLLCVFLRTGAILNLTGVTGVTGVTGNRDP